MNELYGRKSNNCVVVVLVLAAATNTKKAATNFSPRRRGIRTEDLSQVKMKFIY